MTEIEEDMAKGEAPKVQLDDLEKRIEVEMQKWKKANIHPAGVKVDMFMLTAKVTMLTRVVMEKFEIEDEQMMIELSKTVLTELEALRTQITKQQATSSIVLPGGIALPNNKPRLL